MGTRDQATGLGLAEKQVPSGWIWYPRFDQHVWRAPPFVAEQIARPWRERANAVVPSEY
jgi:hypothetical protein